MDNPNFRVGQDVFSTMKSYRKAKEDLESRYSLLVTGTLFLALMGVVMHSCVDAIVQTAEMDEQEARKRIFVEQTYQRPAAFRKASPTSDQMDNYHGLLRVMEVNR